MPGSAAATAAAAHQAGPLHRAVRRRVRSVLTLAAALTLAVELACTVAAFVPPAGLCAGRASAAPGGKAGEAAAGSKAPAEEPDYTPYDWQRVAEAKPSAPSGAAGAAAAVELDMDSLPDLPDLPDEAPEAGVASLGAQVRTREVGLPELPGDPELLPPEPNPVIQGGLGFLEWTGIWIGGLLVIAALGGLGSYALARAKLDPDFADSALAASKFILTAFEFLFFSRVMLAQFPKVKTTDMPWALVHYPTEWALAPTRAVFKPEAGVDISPILWLIVTLLAAELLTGPAGILQMLREGPRGTLPPGMLTR